MLAAILVLAFAIRILAVILCCGAIDIEGAEYGRLAENLFSGVGYVGIAGEGTQLFFPPLFPILIGAVSMLTGDTELAGRSISLIAGALAPLPAFIIAARMYGSRTGLIAAAIIACQPFLIFLSTTVFVEMTFLTVILGAICFAMLATDNPRPRYLIGSGVLYGLAYLMRPEAAAYMLVAAAIVALSMLLRRSDVSATRFARIGLLIVPFICLAAPYIVWLSAQTGDFRLEGKSPLNIATEIRAQKGEPLHAVKFGVDADAREHGVWNQPNILSVKTHDLSGEQLLGYLATKSQAVWMNFSNRFSSGILLGFPLLFVLAIIGLFAQPWHAVMALHQLHFFGILALVMFGTFFIYYDDHRFFVVKLAVMTIWASAGLQRLARWGRATALALGLRRRHRTGFSSLTGLTACFLLLALPAIAAVPLFQKARAEQAVKTAGEWLRDNSPGPLRVLNSSTPMAFHARAQHFWLPYCEEETALRYIERKDVTHVVIQAADIGSVPYIEKWVKEGVPHPDARLVYSFEMSPGESVKIYEIGK